MKALEALGIAFAGLKVSETVLTFMKLASGLKGLLGAGGAGSATGTAAKTAATGTGWWAKTASMAGGMDALVPLWVLGLGLAPAEIAMIQQGKVWNTRYNRRQAAADLNDENSWFIRQAAEALGKDGQVNMGAAEELLMGLSARQNQQKAELYNILKGSTTAGNNTWNLLNSFWGGAALDQTQIDEMLQDITDAFSANAEKAQIPVEVKVPEDAASVLEQDIGTLTIKANIVPSFGEYGEVEEKPKANGIWSVPFDGYHAVLHRGERVVPAREVSSRSFNSNLYVEKMYMSNGQDAAGLSARMAEEQRRKMKSLGS